MIYEELGQFPIEIDVKISMVSFWGSLLLGKETKLSYLSYEFEYMLSFDNNMQVVSLTDALSVLQALMNDNLPQLEQALHTIKTLRTVLQWIPYHCGVHGNEEADRLAKHGAGQQQQENTFFRFDAFFM
jgi:hypothetical protein